MSLYDKIVGQQPPALSSNQTAIEKVLQAKKGRVGGQTTSSLNIGEQAVQADTQAALRQQGLAGGLQQAGQMQERQQAQQQLDLQRQAQEQQGELATQRVESAAARQGRALASQEQMQRSDLDANMQRRINLINANANRTLQGLAADYGMQADDIFSNFRRENTELEFRRDAAQLEQLGHVLAMQDRAYMDELQRIGERRKLYDKSNWAQEKQRVIFGENLSSIMKDLGFRAEEDAKGRAFQERMTQLDLDTALAMAVQAAKDANTTAMASSIISTASKAADTYIKSLESDTPKTSNDLPDYLKTQDVNPLPGESTNPLDYRSMV